MSDRTRNWSEYNAGLKQRGSVTFWLDEAALEGWSESDLSGQRGASKRYSDLAIATFETVKSVYRLAGRQTQGFIDSLFRLMGLNLEVPDHSTVSRRKGDLEIVLPVVPSSRAIHVVIDSTGIKVYGEGEWKTRQHGVSKRRTWLKLHLSVDEASGEILSAVVSGNDTHDSEVFEDLLNGLTATEVEQVSADGAYDQLHCYDALREIGAKAGIPPRRSAKIQRHGNCKAPAHPRDENLRSIRRQGRKKWKRESNYHRRSIAETTMYRAKAAFGGVVRSRKFENQATELLLQCSALNRMIQLAKPESVKVV